MGRWIVRILGGLVVVLLLAAGTVYALSSRIINEKHQFKEHPITVPTDSASVAEGQRLVRMRCTGCHGDSVQGNPAFVDEPMLARIVAPNVPQRLATMTDAEFAGFILSGVRKDGTSPFIMPPPGFYHTSDAELGAMLAYLRSLPVDDRPMPKNSYRLMGRLGVALGQFRTAVYMIDTTQARVGLDPAWATTRRGEYLARLICTECHGPRLTGDSAAGGTESSPSLAGAAGYSRDEFFALLRTATPREPARRLNLMAEMALNSLKLLTDDEINALFDYLKNLPLTGMADSK